LKLTTDFEGVVLTVPTTEKEETLFVFSTENVHYWYPFNINFSYKYSDSKKYLYLTKEKDYEGPNYYDVTILKKTKPLETKNWTMFHQKVYDRNMHIIALANKIGIVTIDQKYTAEDTVYGYEKVARMIEAMKNNIYRRVFGFSELSQPLHTEGWDAEIYSAMTPDEAEMMVEFGEIYAMLTVMRKLT
jgi:hypothetical protein